MELSKKTITIIITILIIILIILSVWVRNLSNRPAEQIPTSAPTPTSYNYLDPTSKSQVYNAPAQDIRYAESARRIYEEEKPFHDQEGAVGALLPLLPQQGTYFSMRYEINRATFVVTIDKKNTEKGNQEFTEFLKSHGVSDKNWIRNLEISTN